MGNARRGSLGAVAPWTAGLSRSIPRSQGIGASVASGFLLLPSSPLAGLPEPRPLLDGGPSPAPRLASQETSVPSLSDGAGTPPSHMQCPGLEEESFPFFEAFRQDALKQILSQVRGKFH